MLDRLTDDGYRSTQIVRISGETLATSADRSVVGHAAFRIDATGTRARTDAAVVNAGPATRTVRVDDALRSARGIRIADVVWRAGAFGAAGRRVAAHGV